MPACFVSLWALSIQAIISTSQQFNCRVMIRNRKLCYLRWDIIGGEWSTNTCSHARNSAKNSNQWLRCVKWHSIDKTVNILVDCKNCAGQRSYALTVLAGCFVAEFCVNPCFSVVRLVKPHLRKQFYTLRHLVYCVLYTLEVFSRLCLRTVAYKTRLLLMAHWGIVLQ